MARLVLREGDWRLKFQMFLPVSKAVQKCCLRTGWAQPSSCMESNGLLPLYDLNSFASLVLIFQVKLSSSEQWPAHNKMPVLLVDNQFDFAFFQGPVYSDSAWNAPPHNPVTFPSLLKWLSRSHYWSLLVKFCVFWYSDRPKDHSLSFPSMTGQYDLVFPSRYVLPLGLAFRNNSVAS